MIRASQIPGRLGVVLRLFLMSLLMPSIALAHPESLHASDLWAGFAHPLTGIDHLLAMIAVGLLAVRLGRAAMLVLPAAFPIAMAIGACMAQAGLSLPMIEPVIGLSVVVIGVAVAIGLSVSLPLIAVLVGCFAVFHGYAHVIEASSEGASLAYGAGFIAATVLLHALGIVAGQLMQRLHADLLRVSGSMIAATGAALLIF